MRFVIRGCVDTIWLDFIFSNYKFAGQKKTTTKKQQTGQAMVIPEENTPRLINDKTGNTDKNYIENKTTQWNAILTNISDCCCKENIIK